MSSWSFDPGDQTIGWGGAEARLEVAVAQQKRSQELFDQRILERADRPALVCAQAGNVNTGAFDPLEPIAAAVRGPRGPVVI